MIDHPAWIAIQNHVEKNIPEYITFVGALAIASVCTMPEKCPLIPGEIDSSLKTFIQQWWTWFRNALQTAVPAARHSQQPPPQQPAGPAQPKQQETLK